MNNLEHIKETILLNFTNNIKLPSKLVIKIETLSNKEIETLSGLKLDAKLIREYIYLFLINFKRQIIDFLRGNQIKEIFISTRDEFGKTRQTITKTTIRVKQMIINLLLKLNIIYISRNYSTGGEDYYSSHSKAYMINTNYINEPITILLNNDKTKSINKKNKQTLLDLINGNKIAENQLKMVYEFIKLDRQKIYEKGIRLVGSKYKGVNFVLNNNNKNKSDKSLENHMNIYDYLMDGDLLIPSISRNNGRVFTSFNLIPSWIREMFLIDNNICKGVDISSSIPSILVSIYGGNKIDYNFIVEKYGVEYNKAKVDILSFLFSNNYEAKKYYSKIYDYFYENNGELLSIIETEKNKIGEKSFANKLFREESNLMTKNITDLEELNIKVFYVFDELIGKAKDNKIIKEIMLKNLEIFGIKTIVK